MTQISAMMDGAILCAEDPDWDWWLKQPPEFRSQAIKAIRMSSDADKLKSYPGFIYSDNANITIVGNTPTTGAAL